MAKPKRSIDRGITKSHGPKRKLFHSYSQTMRLQLSKDGLLNKYCDKESFALACQARGVKSIDNVMWNNFNKLSTVKEKDVWLKNLGK